jgi:hypothetical protein
VKSRARPSSDPLRIPAPAPRQPAQAPAVQRQHEHAVTRDPHGLGEREVRALDEFQGEDEDADIDRPAPDGQMVGVALHQGPGWCRRASAQHCRRAVEPDYASQPAPEPSREVSGPAAHIEHAPRTNVRSPASSRVCSNRAVGPRSPKSPSPTLCRLPRCGRLTTGFAESPARCRRPRFWLSSATPALPTRSSWPGTATSGRRRQEPISRSSPSGSRRSSSHPVQSPH